jgi:hypothetical protein
MLYIEIINPWIKKCQTFLSRGHLSAAFKKPKTPNAKNEKEYSTISVFKLLFVRSAAQIKQNIFEVQPPSVTAHLILDFVTT